MELVWSLALALRVGKKFCVPTMVIIPCTVELPNFQCIEGLSLGGTGPVRGKRPADGDL